MNKILIVEDHYLSAQMLQVMLTKMSLPHELARNGREALDLFDPAVHRVVLLDIQLPDLDGHAIYKHIRAHEHKDSPAIVVAQTAKLTGNEEAQCRGEGFDDFITKPIGYQLLQRKFPLWLALAGVES